MSDVILRTKLLPHIFQLFSVANKLGKFLLNSDIKILKIENNEIAESLI